MDSDPPVFADTDPGSQNVADSTDSGPKDTILPFLKLYTQKLIKQDSLN